MENNFEEGNRTQVIGRKMTAAYTRVVAVEMERNRQSQPYFKTETTVLVSDVESEGERSERKLSSLLS